jgi:pimeloyl-ACP methyl ester carboxylesterase
VSGKSRFIDIGRHRLHATVFGSGEPTVVIEPGFGGRAEHWRDIAGELAGDVTVLTYDRAPYGDSGPAADARTPRDIAGDLAGVLDGLAITGPLVLVGHSSGGQCLRTFAAGRLDRVAGMVLVDSSHEAQRSLLWPALPWKIRLLGKLMVPLIYLSVRGGSLAARRSMAREFRALNKQSRADIALGPGALGDTPLVVLTRPADGQLSAQHGWDIWNRLHQELAGLSRNSRHVVAAKPGHYIHLAEPELVLASIRDVVASARSRQPLSASRG